MPLLHLIAGLPGAGKTTLHRALIAPRHPQLPFVNAQVPAASQWPRTSRDALPGGIEEQRQAHLAAGTSFAAETTFSRATELELITEAQARQFHVVLYALAHDESSQLRSRVALRGGSGRGSDASHQVATPETLCMNLLRQAVFLVDLAFLFDASDASAGGPRLVASVSTGRMQLHTLVRPQWADRILGFAER